MSKHLRRHLVLRMVAFVAVGLLAASGCASRQSRPASPGKLHGRDDLAINREQLRLRMRALVDPVAGKIVETADGIIGSTRDSAVQLAALDWKIEAVPAVREALYQPDPFVALLDTWVLLTQMADFFDHGPGKLALGAASSRAASACRTIEEDFTRIVASGTRSGDVSGARDYARRWAVAHPITHAIADREPALSLAFEKELGASLSLGDAVTDVTVTLDDLNRKVEVYSTQLFRQARWEAERMARTLMAETSADQALPLATRAVTAAERAGATLDAMAPSIEGAARTAARAPDIVAAERAAVVTALAAELQRTLDFARQERGLVFEYVTSERQATLREITTMVTSERQALARDAEQVSVRVIDHAIDRLERLVAAVLAALAVGALASILLVRLLFGRRRTAPPAS